MKVKYPLPVGVLRASSIEHRVVITAAHCLPHLPRLGVAALDSFAVTYKELLGSIDGGKKDVWAECLFVDPVGDVAILCGPDNQEFGDEADAYEALTGDVPPLPIAIAKGGPGWVLSLDGRWVRSKLKVFSSWGGTSLEIDPTEAGQSGSPVLNDAGEAVGLISQGHEIEGKNHRAGPQPILVRNLPGWLFPGVLGQQRR